MDSRSYAGIGWFDFVWLHPPYWNMIRYSRDLRCLSNAPDLQEFLRELDRLKLPDSFVSRP